MEKILLGMLVVLSFLILCVELKALYQLNREVKWTTKQINIYKEAQNGKDRKTED